MVPVLQFKWNMYAAKLFRQELYNYCSLLFVTTWSTILLTQVRTHPSSVRAHTHTHTRVHI